jgi:hypothetical protein
LNQSLGLKEPSSTIFNFHPKLLDLFPPPWPSNFPPNSAQKAQRTVSPTTKPHKTPLNSSKSISINLNGEAKQNAAKREQCSCTALLFKAARVYSENIYKHQRRKKVGERKRSVADYIKKNLCTHKPSADFVTKIRCCGSFVVSPSPNMNQKSRQKPFYIFQHVHELLIASVSLRFDEDGSLVAYSGA